MNTQILIRGGGDLASGVAARLHRAGFQVLITELPQPLVVRRLVSFAEAVYSGVVQVEGISARLADDLNQAEVILAAGEIAVLVDPELTRLKAVDPLVLVDARMTKQTRNDRPESVPMVIGLGPGFSAGKDCHAVVETKRGHSLGRVIWQGQALPDTKLPDTIGGRDHDRVLRAPADGLLRTQVSITDQVLAGDLLADVEGVKLIAPFDGVIRGLLHDGLQVKTGMKIGDLDPRNDPAYCSLISDKALSVGGGVLEALLSKPEIRARLLLS
jgi:xanthine dehydrogenase accessory factor